MSSSMDGASVVSEGPTTRKYRFKTSFLLLTASYIGLFGLIAIIISFSSPYWLSSFKNVYSDFKRLGLWNFCFDHYRHPPYQYDERFTGCRWIYSPMYQNIRDWLQPGWFIFVQAMMTISMLMSVFAMMAISVPIMHFALKYNVVMIGLAFVLECLATLSGVLGWLVFAIKHDTRNWLQYPNWNYLDWAFYVAVLSTALNGAAAVLFAIEGRKAYTKRQRFTNLVYNMHPRFTT